ncbi:hypothetical protein DSO06_06320 [Candidatus Nezhaarchaeota archaeon WYZ-LMO8]|nr:MAG: hypothetical protein DSO06_06320 [Candidatus Nezhaarchaeota archaeon WYZ-LMO8]TDA37191.1 MAG: hypothetical protein DSO05_01160 [Candidatus Nezhaarchaeota archaeon WYZ-LMO7]
MLTTDVGKERWTAWEVIDTIFPYDTKAYVRAFNDRGVVLVWSRLPSHQLIELLTGRLTRAHRLVELDDASPARLRDIIVSARRVLRDLKEVSVESRIRGNYLEVSEEELSRILMDKLGLIGGEVKLVVEVVWDVAGISLRTVRSDNSLRLI